MNHQGKILCDHCRKQPATIHSTVYSGETTQSRDLCLACWEQTASPHQRAGSRRFQDIMAAGKCKYCGGPATGGSGWTSMEDKPDLWCERCRADFAEFMGRPENNSPDVISDDSSILEQDQHRSTVLMAAADAYVRQRATERNSGRL